LFGKTGEDNFKGVIINNSIIERTNSFADRIYVPIENAQTNHIRAMFGV